VACSRVLCRPPVADGKSDKNELACNRGLRTTTLAMKETKMRAFAQSQRKLDGENKPANQIAP